MPEIDIKPLLKEFHKEMLTLTEPNTPEQVLLKYEQKIADYLTAQLTKML